MHIEKNRASRQGPHLLGWIQTWARGEEPARETQEEDIEVEEK